MAIVATASNHVKYQLGKKLIDLSSDTLKIILMNTSFAFDKDAHATLADVTASQLTTGNGYTQDNKELAGKVFTEDDTNDKATLSCDDVTFTAVGGDIGPSGSYIIYDDTTSDDTIIACIDFGADYTILEDASLQFTDILISLA